VPTLFSLGSLTLVYIIGKRLWGDRVAFMSTLAMGLTPMFRAYGQLVNHESPSTFFILGVLYCYILWVETKICRYLIALCVFMAFGCFTAWPMYYMVPLLVVHYLIFGKDRKVKTVVSIVMTGAIMFSLFVFHAYLLEGSNAVPEMEKVLKFRASYDDKTEDWRMDNMRVFLDSLNTVKRANTPYLFYAAGLLVSSIVYGIFKKEDIIKESYVLVLLLVAAIHNLLWPVGFLYHDYWSYYFTPAIALASISGIHLFIKGDRDYKEFVVWLALIVIWLSTLSDRIPDPL